MYDLLKTFTNESYTRFSKIRVHKDLIVNKDHVFLAKSNEEAQRNNLKNKKLITCKMGTSDDGNLYVRSAILPAAPILGFKKFHFLFKFVSLTERTIKR